MSQAIELQFENASGGTVTYKFDNPVQPFNTADVKQAMNTIIAKNVFTSSGGDIVKIKDARIVERNVTEIPVNPS